MLHLSASISKTTFESKPEWEKPMSQAAVKKTLKPTADSNQHSEKTSKSAAGS